MPITYEATGSTTTFADGLYYYLDTSTATARIATQALYLEPYMMGGNLTYYPVQAPPRPRPAPPLPNPDETWNERVRRYVAGIRSQRVLPTAEDVYRQRTAKERAAANRKAACLLRRVLTDDEYKEYKEHKWVTVPSSRNPALAYRIRGDGNIVVIDATGRIPVVVDSLCIHNAFGHPIPEADLLTGRVLWAKYREDDLIKTANHHAHQGRGQTCPLALPAKEPIPV